MSIQCISEKVSRISVEKLNVAVIRAKLDATRGFEKAFLTWRSMFLLDVRATLSIAYCGLINIITQ